MVRVLIRGTYTCVIISRNNDPCSTRNESPLDVLFVQCTVLEETIIGLCKIKMKNELFTEYQLHVVLGVSHLFTKICTLSLSEARLHFFLSTFLSNFILKELVFEIKIHLPQTTSFLLFINLSKPLSFNKLRALCILDLDKFHSSSTLCICSTS